MKIAGWLISALLVAAACGSAQDTPPPPMPGDRPHERIEQWKKVRLIEILDLKEDQSVRFFSRLKEHDLLRRKLMKQKGEALDRIDRLVRNRAAAAELEKAFPEALEIDVQLAAERTKFFQSLSDILTTEQRARLLLFERQFEKELREAMREAQRKRWRQEEH